MASVFTRIIKGELPSYKIHEDSETYSFLAIPPNTLGHTLVVPKQEIDHFIDVPEALYLRVMERGKLIARALHRAFECQRIGTMVQGFEVPHFHLHLIPMNGPEDMDFARATLRGEEEMDRARGRILTQLTALETEIRNFTVPPS